VRLVDGVAWANDAAAAKYVRLPAKYNLRLTTVSSPARMSSGNPPTASTSRVMYEAWPGTPPNSPDARVGACAAWSRR
jgi:hypothetical protein